MIHTIVKTVGFRFRPLSENRNSDIIPMFFPIIFTTIFSDDFLLEQMREN